MRSNSEFIVFGCESDSEVNDTAGLFTTIYLSLFWYHCHIVISDKVDKSQTIHTILNNTTFYSDN